LIESIRSGSKLKIWLTILRIPERTLGVVVRAHQSADFELDLGVRHHPRLHAFLGGEQPPHFTNRRIDDRLRDQRLLVGARGVRSEHPGKLQHRKQEPLQ